MIVELSHINKDFPQGKDVVHILKNICLQVEEGDYIAIMGPSGSGKTTLMNLIGCLDVPTSGTYVLDGEDLGKCSDNQLADIRNRKIGFVFQQFNLLPKLTALDNVALPLLYRGVPKKERREIARKALEVVGLSDRMDFYPNQLSGGQSQRVAIARAVCGEPMLLLADEPTGALDSAAGEQVMEIFKQLHDNGATIIMITHEQFIADHANKIYYIRDGRLDTGNGFEEEETPAEADAEEEKMPEETKEVTPEETSGEATAEETPEEAADDAQEETPEDIPVRIQEYFPSRAPKEYLYGESIMIEDLDMEELFGDDGGAADE